MCMARDGVGFQYRRTAHRAVEKSDHAERQTYRVRVRPKVSLCVTWSTGAVVGGPLRFKPRLQLRKYLRVRCERLDAETVDHGVGALTSRISRARCSCARRSACGC